MARELLVRSNLDQFSVGIQVLREYIHFNDLNLVKLYENMDKYLNYTVSLKDFKLGLKSSLLYFTEENIDQIIMEAPKPANKQLIDYKQLDTIIKNGPQPQTDFSMQNQFSNIHYDKEEFVKYMNKGIDYQKKNYFDRVTDFSNLKNFDLILLQTEQMKTKQIRQQVIIKDAQQIIFEKINDLFAMNNRLILYNFMIEISQALLPLNRQDDENLYMEFCIQMSVNMSMGMQTLFLSEFVKKFKKLNLSLHEDEIELFHYLIWKELNFKPITVKQWFQTMNIKRKLKKKELLKIQFKSDSDAHVEKWPSLWNLILQEAYQYGPFYIQKIIDAVNQNQKTIPNSQFKKCLEILSISYTKKDLDELQLYLADNNCLELDNYQRISEADIQLNIVNFIEMIHKSLKELNYEIKPQNIIIKDDIKKNFYQIQQKAYLSIFDRLKDRMIPFCEDNKQQYISEAQARRIISQEFGKIDQQDIDQIFELVDSKIQGDPQNPQNKYNVHEIIDLMKFGPDKLHLDKQFMQELRSEQLNTQIQKSQIINQQPLEKINPKQQATIDELQADLEFVGFTEQVVKYAPSYVMQTDYQQSIDNFKEQLIKYQKKNPNLYPQGNSDITIGLHILCQKADTQRNGIINIQIFQDILDQNFDLSDLDIIVIMELVNKISCVDINGIIQNKLMRYSLFCLRMEEFFLLNEIV